MSVDLNKLQGMDAAALHTLARQQGLTLHHKLSSPKVIKAIVDHIASPKAPAHELRSDGAPVLQVQAPVHNNTPEMVEEAIAHIKARAPNLRTSYGDDNTWLFQSVEQSGRVGCEESGNLAIPLRIIIRQANTISQGRRVMRVANDHFDRMNVGGNNAYTNNVLGG